MVLAKVKNGIPVKTEKSHACILVSGHGQMTRWRERTMCSLPKNQTCVYHHVVSLVNIKKRIEGSSGRNGDRN